MLKRQCKCTISIYQGCPSFPGTISKCLDSAVVLSCYDVYALYKYEIYLI